MMSRDIVKLVCDNTLFCRYVELLSKHKPKLKWDDHCSEHYFTYK